MIKEIKEINFATLLEVTLQFPLKDVNDVSMFVSKNLTKGSYIFSIPVCNWDYEATSGKKIDFSVGPSGFNSPKYKSELISSMEYILKIVDNIKL